MKKLLLLPFLALFSSFLFAQDTPDDFANRVRYIFQHVDASQANTGIMMDCGVEFVHMDNYTGYTTLNDSNYVNLNTWRGIYASLYSAKFNSNINFTDFATINSNINTATADTLPIPLLLLNYNYQVLRTDAISANLMYASNDQLYDVSNRTQSPYTFKTAFAIAPAEDYLKAINGYASFVFKSSLMFGNTGKTISTLKMDLGDGQGWRTVQADIAINTQYSSGGFKTFNYEVTYTDNSIYQGHSRVYIEYEQESFTPGGGDNRSYPNNGLDTVITASTSMGIKAATLQIRLSDTNTSNTIQKPLIVVEGIDFWRITTPNNLNENTDVNDFLNNASFGRLFQTGNLRDSLDLTGYDIIYIDFEDGADYLENNSALTQRAIQWVDSAKTTSTQNVVMGLSMGAVVARHALRTMEINNVPHNTSLYISMDGPQQGGNFPLSLQALITHLNKAEFSLFWGALPILKLSDAFEGLDVAKAILDAPASKQLLKYRVSGIPQIGNGLNVDNTPHDTFYSNLRNNLGYPTLTRNIAISNGSECGSDQGFAPLATIYEQDSTILGGGLAYLADVVSSMYQLNFGILTNKPLISLYAPLAVLSTKTSFVSQFYAKALPDHGTDRIYFGRVGIKRKVLGLFNVYTNITNRNLNALSYMLPLDSSPGGRADFGNAAGLGIPDDFATLVNIGGFSYIPTVSGLDIGGGNTTISTPQLYSAYSINNPPASPNNSPFDSFVTAVGNTNNGGNNNEDHVTFTPRNGSFLLKELKGNISTPANCAIFCNTSNLIQGPSQFCTTETYTIPNLPAGATVFCSINPSSGVASISTSGNTVTLTKLSVGSLTLSANVNTLCGAITLDKIINILDSPNAFITATPQNGLYGKELRFDVDYQPNCTYEWRLDGGVISNSTGFILNAPDCGNQPYQNLFEVSLKITSDCGQESNACRRYTFDCNTNSFANGDFCGLIEIFRLQNSSQLNYFPNPANAELIIDYKAAPLKNEEIEKTVFKKTVTLFDKTGKVMFSKTYNQKEFIEVIDTKNMQDGSYFLHFVDGKETIKKQIIIKH